MSDLQSYRWESSENAGGTLRESTDATNAGFALASQSGDVLGDPLGDPSSVIPPNTSCDFLSLVTPRQAVGRY